MLTEDDLNAIVGKFKELIDVDLILSMTDRGFEAQVEISMNGERVASAIDWIDLDGPDSPEPPVEQVDIRDSFNPDTVYSLDVITRRGDYLLCVEPGVRDFRPIVVMNSDVVEYEDEPAEPLVAFHAQGNTLPEAIRAQ